MGFWKRLLSSLVVITSIISMVACTPTVKFTITFDSNGGTPATQEVTTDGQSQISMPSDPTKEGFSFAGWYWDNNTFSNSFTANSLLDQPLSSNLTVYAKWVEGENIPIGSLKVTFNSMGGSEVEPSYVMRNQTVPIPTVSRDGYILDGWYTSLNEGTTLDEKWSFTTLTVANPLTLYAKWNVIIYNITYEPNGGTTFNSPSSYTIESNTINLSHPSKDGYTFAGWYDNTELNGNAITSIQAGSSGDVTLFAKWTINEYTLFYEENGGSSIADLTLDYGSTLTAPNEPTKTGYTFGGWYKTSALTTVYTFTTMPSESITVYAKWNLSSFTITYQLNGGELIKYYAQSYTINSQTIDLPSPLREGYTFSGWYSNPELNGQTLENIQSGSFGNIELYAKWTELTSFIITIDTSGGFLENTRIVAYEGIQIIDFGEPRKLGYVFNSWEFNGETISLPFEASSDMTIVATYRELAPQEILFDYYVNESTSGNWIYNSGTNYVETTPDSNSYIRYFESGIFEYYFIYDEFELEIMVDLINSTISYEDEYGWYYSRDFLFKTYQGNISMDDYEFIETLFDSILGPIDGSPVQTEIFEIYGKYYQFSDFNPNWDELEMLPDNHYKTYEMEVMEDVSVIVYDFEISFGGNYVYYYYTIKNNSSEILTFLELTFYFSAYYTPDYGFLYSDYTYWFGTLQPGATTSDYIIIEVINLFKVTITGSSKNYEGLYAYIDVFVTDISF